MRKALYRPLEDRKPARSPSTGWPAASRWAAPSPCWSRSRSRCSCCSWSRSGSRWSDLDRSVADSLNSVARGDGALVRRCWTAGRSLFDPWVFRLVVLGVAVWLWRRGAKRLAAWAVVTMVVGGVLGVVLKLLVDRARPAFPEPVAHASGYSFPSGHALNSMLCVGVLILVFLPVLRGAGRLLAYAVGALLVLLTGFDRVALGRPLRQRRARRLGGRAGGRRRHVGGVRDLAPRARAAARPTVLEGVEPGGRDEMIAE